MIFTGSNAPLLNEAFLFLMSACQQEDLAAKILKSKLLSNLWQFHGGSKLYHHYLETIYQSIKGYSKIKTEKYFLDEVTKFKKIEKDAKELLGRFGRYLKKKTE